MEKLIDRLVKVIHYKGMSINQADIALGAGNGYIGKQLKSKGSVNSNIIETFLNKYTDIDAEWLMTGRGDMLKSSPQIENGNNSNHSDFEKLRTSNEKLEELLHFNMHNAKKIQQNYESQIEQLHNEIKQLKSKLKPATI